MGLKAVANLGGGGGGTVTGTGTPDKLAKFATASSIGDSVVTELAGKIGINCAPGTLLSVSDGIVSAPSYAGIRLGNTAEALFSSSDSIRGFRAGVTGATVVAGSTTSHDVLLQRGNVTALTLGASGAVTFAGNLTSSAAQTWTLAAGSTSALNIQSGLLNLDTTNSRVGVGTASPIGTFEVRAANPTIVCSNSSVRYGYSVWNDAASEFRTGTGNAHAFALLTDNFERMRIDATGNVGIGTKAPSGPLSVTPLQYSTGTASQALLVVTGVGTTFTAAMVGSQLVFASGVSAGTITAFTNATTITVSISQTVTSQAYKISYTGLQVSTGGNVGIGTTSPTDRLTISGGGLAITGNITGATTAANSLVMDNSGGTSRFYSIGASAASFGNYVFYVSKSGGSPGATAACTIDQAAGVLLGSTSTAVFNASTSGQGLKLPATPGNADSQTLDCYAEGTWTPTLSAAASWGGTQPAVSVARYVRIGSTVHCTVVLVGAPNFSSTYLATTITAPFSATYNAAVPISSGATAFGCAQHNAGGTTLFLPTFGVVGAATFSWTFIV